MWGSIAFTVRQSAATSGPSDLKASLEFPGKLASRSAADLVQVHKKVVALGTKPLFGALALRAEAPHREPELLGVVWNGKMHGFMSDQISKNECWCHYQPPIK